MYIRAIPRLSWFSSSEQEEMVIEASRAAQKQNENFYDILADLAFERSIKYGKQPQ